MVCVSFMVITKLINQKACKFKIMFAKFVANSSKKYLVND